MFPDHETRWKKYGQKHSDHTKWREYTLQVSHPLGFVFGYIALRELPLRNFYARSFIMFVYASTVFSQYKLPLPLLSRLGSTLAIKDDEYYHRRLSNFPIAYKTGTSYIPPSDSNSYSSYLLWAAGNPAQINIQEQFTINTLGLHYTKPKPVQWDGTFSMPTRVIPDKEHKYGAGLRFI